ncbi:hypothetical protein FB45DRAFT_1139881 [Roridomyces roridus]|uniref:Uncharacterized protein n=1 Tax=Roridomyces roridus TaxID=1738132 RepID=A0AAD7B086_9AGAR|nr:hypothetical protein FB45DRAFT_1139881 [Roridomyces roridus]
MSMDKTKFPSPFGGRALHFKADEPHMLGWYLDNVEELCTAYHAKTDDEKKWVAIRYAAPELQREWVNLERYKDGTYEEFVKELYMNYPEAKKAEKGSVMLLDKPTRPRACFLVRSSKSRKNPYASFARRLREIAQNNVIKLKYQLSDELDLSDRREEERRGHTIASYPDIAVLQPHICAPLSAPVLKAVKNYLLQTFEVSEDEWGKISFLDGGDKIRGADLVESSEKNMTREASFIKKYSHEVDVNRNFRHKPVLLQREIVYGQLLRVIEFHADIPSAPDDNGRLVQQARTVWLAVIRPVKLLGKSKRLGIPFYKDNAPIEVVDVDDLSCLVARIPDHEPGPPRWALCERQDAMGAGEENEE